MTDSAVLRRVLAAPRVARLMCVLIVLSVCLVGQAAPPIAPDEGVPHVAWQDAPKVVGKVAYVHGKVIRVEQRGRVTILKFEDNWPGRFGAVVYQSDLKNFPQPIEDLYNGKLIEVRGMVRPYATEPQVTLVSPKQVTILEKAPTSKLPEPRQFRGDTLKIATFNILNLFDTEDDLYHADEGTPPKPRAEIERVAQYIRTLDADVLALQEVESRGYLQRFVDVFLPEEGYEVVHYEGNDLRGIDVCLLTRVPVGAVTSYRHLHYPDGKGGTRRVERDFLCVELLPPGHDPIEVCVVHLKSNSGGRDLAEPIRLAETKALRKILDQRLDRNPHAKILVCGDFNDTWESESTQAVVGSGTTGLRSFHEDWPEKQRVTYNRKPYLSMIDFIMCSPAAAQMYVPKSYKLIPGSPELSGSDHNPVMISLKLK
jgi:endonuclease/exonuclease/phosphatase family metal-dependent hydrolase